MGKTRVAVKLKEAVGGKSLNKSADLEAHRQAFNTFSKKLKALIGALKNHYGSMMSIAKTRLEVAQHVAELSKQTPLFEHVGQLPNDQRSSETVTSYLYIQEGLHNKAKMYVSKYAEFVINYSVEWERIVTHRVTTGLKKEEKLRVEVDHYQEKVESLRTTANSALAKGKMVDTKTADRLGRNEEKLKQAKTAHQTFSQSLCILIDEVTDRSWRDLHPLLVKLAQFDMTLSEDESKALAKLDQVVNELKRVAATHGIKPQARLKDLDNLDPSLLNTKQPDPSKLIEDGTAFGTLSVKSDHSLGGLSGDSFGGALVPAPGGGNDPFAANGPMGAFPTSVPTTLDVLSYQSSAAPPPTLDQINSAVGMGSSGGGLPPMPPPQATRTRNQSYDSLDSGFSFASGLSAPPAAPPPPPPTQFGQDLVGTNPFESSGPSSYSPAPPPYGIPQQQPQQSSSYSYGSPPPLPNSNNAMTSYSNNGGYNNYSAPAPVGAPPPAPNNPFGQQPQYGQPQQQGYGGGGYQQQQQCGQPPPLPPQQQQQQYQQYGQPPPPQQQKPQGGTNPFDF